MPGGAAHRATSARPSPARAGTARSASTARSARSRRSLRRRSTSTAAHWPAWPRSTPTRSAIRGSRRGSCAASRAPPPPARASPATRCSARSPGDRSPMCWRGAPTRRSAAEQRREPVLVEDLDAEPSRPSAASSRRSRRPPRSVVFSETEPSPCRRPSISAARPRPRHSSVPVRTNVMPAQRARRCRRPLVGPSSMRTPARRRSSTNVLVLGVAEPRGHGVGDHRADPLDGLDLLAAGASRSASMLPKWRASAWAVTQPTCGIPSRTRRPGERPRARRVDRGDHVLGRPLLEPLERQQVVDGEPVEVGRPARPAELPEAEHELLAHAVDVHRAARDEVLEQPRSPRLGQFAVGAAVARLALGPLHGLAAGRAALGIANTRSLPSRSRVSGPDHLRDHVAGALHDHRVADRGCPCGGCRPRCAASRASRSTPPTSHRLEDRERVQRAGAPDVDADVVQLRGRA